MKFRKGLRNCVVAKEKLIVIVI